MTTLILIAIWIWWHNTETQNAKALAWLTMFALFVLLIGVTAR